MSYKIYTIDDIISVISYICNKEIEWIQENSFIYDNDVEYEKTKKGKGIIFI